jgi:predicted nucleic-acid-binding protein
VIALDTNVLLRIFKEDDAEQSACAKSLVERALVESAHLFVTQIAVCEFVWVLASSYRQSRTEIATTLAALLSIPEFEVENHRDVQAALEAYRSGRGDFADYLIRERGRSAGAHAVATFDKPLLKEDGFVHPDPKRWRDDLSFHEETPRYGARRRRVRA